MCEPLGRWRKLFALRHGFESTAMAASTAMLVVTRYVGVWGSTVGVVRDLES
jgi:hypothetical protein